MEQLLVVAFVAGFLQGAAGFGFTLVMAPASVVLLPSAAVVGTVARAALVVDIALARLDGRGVDRCLLARYTIPAIASLPAAFLLMALFPTAVLAIGGGVLTLAASFAIRRSRVGEVGATGPGAPTAGFTSGLLGVTTGLSGPPLAVHVARSGMDPASARGTLAWLFVAIDGIAVLANPLAVDMPTMALLGAAGLTGTAVGRRSDEVLTSDHRRVLSISLIASAGMLCVAGAIV